MDCLIVKEVLKTSAPCVNITMCCDFCDRGILAGIRPPKMSEAVRPADITAPHAHCWVRREHEKRYVPCSHPMKLCDYCGVAHRFGVVFRFNKTVKAQGSESWLEFIERNGKETMEEERQ